jgi:hypothetical protein
MATFLRTFSDDSISSHLTLQRWNSRTAFGQKTRVFCFMLFTVTSTGGFFSPLWFSQTRVFYSKSATAGGGGGRGEGFCIMFVYRYRYRIQPAKINADPCGSGYTKISRVILELLQTCNLAFKHLNERFSVGGFMRDLLNTYTYMHTVCVRIGGRMMLHLILRELETKFRRSCRLSHPQLIHLYY